MKPSQILANLCKREGLPQPELDFEECKIGGKKFTPENQYYKDARGLNLVFRIIYNLDAIGFFS